MFENTCPLSFNSEIIINSNTIGKQDAQLRAILAAHPNVFYFCGHVHASLGVIDPWKVEVENVGSFWELNLAAIKAAARAYMNVPATWVMFAYDNEVVLRARDFTTGQWLTEFDVVIKLEDAFMRDMINREGTPEALRAALSLQLGKKLDAK